MRETNPVVVRGLDYKAVGASATDQVLGTTGSIGDRLDFININIVTSATATVSIKDGAGGSAITLLTGAAALPVGAVSLNLGGIYSTSGGWRVTTGAGATALASGRFDTNV